MIELGIRVGIPFLWGDRIFEKQSWGKVNFLVGPNGTGKTVLARKLIELLPQANPELKIRFVSSDRLHGSSRSGAGADNLMFEGIRYEDFARWREEGRESGLSAAALVILKDKLDVRLRVEAGLSQLFRRRLDMVESNGGITPRLTRLAGGWEYGLDQDECHGLRELIALLAFLYDDEYNCLIIDEPELHLHPQFQTFLMQEIRRLAGNPLESGGRKLFFIVTHSPYFVDVRTVSDLQHCLVFRPDNPPEYIRDIDKEDFKLLKRFLPRLNTHHKQFFFSVRPVFVEGYTDQQIFSLIQERRGRLLGAAGECFIDVGGKDELDLFYRLCRKLGIQAQAVTDLDALFGGRLLRTLSEEGLLRGDYGSGEERKEDFLAAVKRRMRPLAHEVSRLKNMRGVGAGMRDFITWLRSRADEDARVYAFYLGLMHYTREILSLLPQRRREIEWVMDRMEHAREELSRLGIHVLARGQLEHYLPSSGDSLQHHFADSAKRVIFERERDFILHDKLDEARIAERYGDLLELLDRATGHVDIDLSAFLTAYLADFAARVKALAGKGQAKDRDELLGRPELDYKHFSRLLAVEEYDAGPDGAFRCRVRLDGRVDPQGNEIEFDESTEIGKLSFKSLIRSSMES